MYQFILLIHVFVAVCIVGLVLVQQGKGATLGAAFGSGASQTIFGSRGSGSFLFKITIGFAALFFITSLVLNNLATHAVKQERAITLPNIPSQSAPARQESGGNTAQLPMPTSSLPGEIPVKK